MSYFRSDCNALHLTDWITDGEIIALGAEDGQQPCPPIVDRTGDQQRDDGHRQEHDRLRDQYRQQKVPVHRAPVQLRQGEKDHRRQRERADERVQPFRFKVADDVEPPGKISEEEKKNKEKEKQ